MAPPDWIIQSNVSKPIEAQWGLKPRPPDSRSNNITNKVLATIYTDKELQYIYYCLL